MSCEKRRRTASRTFGKISSATSGRNPGHQAKEEEDFEEGEGLRKSGSTSWPRRFSGKNSEEGSWFCWIDQSWPRISEGFVPGTGKNLACCGNVLPRAVKEPSRLPSIAKIEAFLE